MSQVQDEVKKSKHLLYFAKVFLLAKLNSRETQKLNSVEPAIARCFEEPCELFLASHMAFPNRLLAHFGIPGFQSGYCFPNEDLLTPATPCSATCSTAFLPHLLGTNYRRQNLSMNLLQQHTRVLLASATKVQITLQQTSLKILHAVATQSSWPIRHPSGNH